GNAPRLRRAGGDAGAVLGLQPLARSRGPRGAVILRSYQVRAVRKVLAYAVENPTGRVLLVIPTRGGKTLVGAMLVLQMAVRNGPPAVWLAHREELLDEAVEHIAEVGIPRASIGVIKRGRSSDSSAKVQVASEQTLANRRLPPAAIVVTDESHR